MLPVTRFLKAANVRLSLAGGRLDRLDPERDPETERRRLKAEVVEELIDLFMTVDSSTDPAVPRPHIANRSKFAQDFRFRESQGSTALEKGLAVPHVRSAQARQITLVMARSPEGVWYDAPDGQATRLFFGISAPPWEKEWYLPFWQWISQTFRSHADWLPEALLSAQTADEMIRLLAGLE